MATMVKGKKDLNGHRAASPMVFKEKGNIRRLLLSSKAPKGSKASDTIFNLSATSASTPAAPGPEPQNLTAPQGLTPEDGDTGAVYVCVTCLLRSRDERMKSN